jgi:hypothetical protein
MTEDDLGTEKEGLKGERGDTSKVREIAEGQAIVGAV